MASAATISTTVSKLNERHVEESIESKSRTLSPIPSLEVNRTVKPRYINNLLPAIGYLDLANGLDFPANVWNQVPVPTFAKVLMGVGGSIAFLSTGFAVVDLRRSWRNIKFLRRERALLKQHRSADPQLRILEESWLDVNFRELCWEIIDRFMLDICMLIAGVLVGAGTLMAIKGDIPAVYHASNLLSGYIGNSFVAVYAAINLAWAGVMWKRASRNHMAFKHTKGSFKPETQQRIRKYTRRHQIFAIVNGPAAVISGVASMISATLPPGYYVLIPGIIGSVFANHFWRIKLGYSRYAMQDWVDVENLDILGRFESMINIRAALRKDAGDETNFCESIVTSEKPENRTITTLLQDHEMYQGFLTNLQQNGFVQDMDCTNPEQALANAMEMDFRRTPKIVSAVNACIRKTSKTQFRYEERFLSELYGCYCYQLQAHSSKMASPVEAESQLQP